MSSSEDQREQLKRHFAKRVTNQARVVLDAWQHWLDQKFADPRWLEELEEANEKLGKYAARFDMMHQLSIAQKISTTLKELRLRDQGLSPESQASLSRLMDALAESIIRKTDRDAPEAPRTFLRSPVYLAFNQYETAYRIIKQMDFFGFRGQQFETAEELLLATQKHKPETIVIDVDFGETKMGGINLIKQIQANHETPIPVIFVCDDEGDIETRLQAVRAGGEEFFACTVDPGQLVEKIESYTRATPQEPYRVLVVDDSRAQAVFIENALKKAGMIPKVITDPMQVLIALEQFSPEIIIMDMYMPGCTGMELAKVIRQQDKFVSVPIIYLSAEDDINKQLHAMSLGGDDFLTKPINPRHLVATIHNRGRRARSLQALMIRDSLTGLYNHTHTLYLLETEILKAQKSGNPLTFVMMDIDNFKKINDTYGHAIGDRVLKSLALFLKQRLRKTDHIGRYGGEEFAIVLPNTTESDAKQMLNDIRERFSDLRQPAGDQEFRVTFSCGVAQSRGESAQALSERADRALYEAKHAGRNCVRVNRDNPVPEG